MKKINTVLLIDDDEPTNFINKKIIKSSGLVETIYVVNGGREGLEFLSLRTGQAPDHTLPDLIFLDINMPAMDGWEFLAEYKKLKNLPVEKIKVVMLTTSQNPDDAIKAEAIAGVYSYKNKPLTRQMIEELIS